MANDLFAYLDQKADQYGIPRQYARAVMMQESGGNPNAISPAGAVGPMQLMRGTARDLRVNPDDPYQNIDGGVRYLAQNADKYGLVGALAAYNGGPGRWERAGGDLSLMPAETQNYVKKITGNLGGDMRWNNTLAGIGQVGNIHGERVSPEILQEIEAEKQMRAAMLPLALGASMSGNEGFQNMGSRMLPFAMEALTAKQLKNGQVLPGGMYVSDVDTPLDVAMAKGMMTPGKTPTGTMLEGANEAIGMVNILNNLQGRFKDSYVSATPFDTIGKFENLVGRTMGMGLQDQGSWWSDYSQFLNDLRNSKFGATLTKGEAKAFEEEATSPGKTAADVRRTVSRQIEVLKNKLMEQAQMGQDSGYNMTGVSNAINRSFGPQVGNAPTTATGRTGELTDEQILKQYGLR